MRMTKRTKRFFAAAALLSLSAGMTFAETHELVKAHTLESSAGTISFGAWGRSTFELGHSNSSTKVTVDMTSLATSATASAESDIAAYEAAKSSGTLSAVNAAVTSLGVPGVESVDLADDKSNI
ncbi:MAG: hypothetical protein IIU02_07985, partial [Treponema sp.]|uniref:hypothetical protein n=1 Tax=Treponema sp. TaxID=166 RepID=UPI00257B67C6